MTKISDATLVASATDNMKMPTGEVGDLALSVGQIKANVIADTNALYDALGAAAAAQAAAIAAAATDATTKANAAVVTANAYTDSGLSGKQNTLVSGTNIKTINGNSLLGSGDLTISGLTGSGTINQIAYFTGSNTLSSVATIGVSNGGTGTSTQFTQGSAIFAGASGVYSQNNAKYFWNDSSETLFIGANSTTFTGVKLNSIGTTNSYLQNNIQNLSIGATASSDWVATADDGTDATKYIDLGINSSGWSGTGMIDGQRYGYLYSKDVPLSIGTDGATTLRFFTGGTAAANERISITSSGSIIIPSSVTTGTDATSGLDFQANSLTSGYGTNITSSTITSGRLLRLNSTSTVINHTAGTNGLLTVSSSGANSTSSKVAIGIDARVINTGTTSTNIAGYFSASGGTTNIAINAPTGSVVFGHTTLDAATTRLLVRGIGTSTGSLARFENSSGTLELALLDRGDIYALGPIGVGAYPSNLSGFPTISSFTTGTTPGIVSYQNSTDSNPANIIIRKSRGTSTSPTIVVDGDYAGALLYSGSAGTGGYFNTAGIYSKVNGTVSTSSVPMDIRFFTTGGTNPSGGSDYDTNTRLIISATGNAGLFGATTYGSGVGVLSIKNAGTNASASITDGIIIHAKDSSAGSVNSTLALYTEEAPEATATFTQTHRYRIWINGVEYWISLDSV